MTKLLSQCYKKRVQESNFCITFGYLVSADQAAINCNKPRLRRKLTQTLIFPKSSYDSIGICIYSYGFMTRRNMKHTNRALSPCQML